MGHVRAYCKHSRLAKALNLIQNDSEAIPLDVFPPHPGCLLEAHPFKGLHGVEGEIRQLDGHATRERVHPFIPLFLSFHKLGVCVCVFVFYSFLSSLRYSRSILNVSSVAGSARTMSGSLSMCSPSRVSGSIFSSSRGN